MNVRQISGSSKGGLNGATKINPDNFTRSPACGQQSMTTLPATPLKNDFVLKELGLDWTYPAKELLSVAFIFMSEVSPLPTEASSSRLFVAFHFIQICKSWYATDDRKNSSTFLAMQFAFDDFFGFEF